MISFLKHTTHLRSKDKLDINSNQDTKKKITKMKLPNSKSIVTENTCIYFFFVVKNCRM